LGGGGGGGVLLSSRCDATNDLLFLQVVKNETGHYGTELFTEVAERIIDTHNKSEPLYLYLAQQAVHSANMQDPLQAPQRLLDVCKIILLTSKF